MTSALAGSHACEQAVGARKGGSQPLQPTGHPVERPAGAEEDPVAEVEADKVAQAAFPPAAEEAAAKAADADVHICPTGASPGNAWMTAPALMRGWPQRFPQWWRRRPTRLLHFSSPDTISTPVTDNLAMDPPHKPSLNVRTAPAGVKASGNGRRNFRNSRSRGSFGEQPMRLLPQQGHRFKRLGH
jgi:hypothetical protein